MCAKTSATRSGGLFRKIFFSKVSPFVAQKIFCSAWRPSIFFTIFDKALCFATSMKHKRVLPIVAEVLIILVFNNNYV